MCPKPDPYPLYSALSCGYQPFCSAVRILSEQVHSPHSFTTYYPQSSLIECTTDVHSLKKYFSLSNVERSDKLEEIMGAGEFE